MKLNFKKNIQTHIHVCVCVCIYIYIHTHTYIYMIYFKELAHTVVEVGKSEICMALSGKLETLKTGIDAVALRQSIFRKT